MRIGFGYIGCDVSRRFSVAATTEGNIGLSARSLRYATETKH